MKTMEALIWKLLERFGVQGIQFVLQIVLARILDPEHYGVLSIMIIFVNLANVFIQNGFNTALVQNKDVTEEDYSSVLWLSIAIACCLYVVLFFCVPFIADFYAMPAMVKPFRVLALVLPIGAFNSVQVAKLSRELDFKRIFRSNILAIIVAGIVGISVAFAGGGLWALVAQTLTNIFTATLVMVFTVSWRPRLVCSIQRIKVLFSFGWKLLVSSLMEALYQDIYSLVIGKKYDSKTLAFNDKGKQFPQFIINAVNGSVQSVMLPVMSRSQDDRAHLKSLMRNSISLSAYIIFPLMAGLASVAPNMVRVLLTEKWMPCVPFIQIYCFSLAFYPVHTCNLQAINAMGRSDLFLKLEFIKKGYGMLALVVAVFCFDSPLAIASTGLITTWISWFVNAFPNRKLVGYSYKEQIVDIFPSLLISFFMCVIVSVVGKLNIMTIIVLLLQVFAGIIGYIALSVVFKIRPFMIIKDKVLRLLAGKIGGVR